ncbi:amidohydrolase family protein [Rhodopila sp.]|uniref:amidohydrolase family protein n=1 Tax=Rhodopila sp. TaxID=2480087 RepID=UPI003D137732
MTSTQAQTSFGRIFPPRDAWLAKAPPEPIIDPDLPIIDTHHHLWHRTAPTQGESWHVPAFRYLMHEFLADCATGHTIVGSVFLQCHSMYRATGPAPMRPVGETEFVAGIAAMADSGGYAKTRVGAGIVGYADLTAGDWVTPVLEAHIRAGGGRFRGVRHSAGHDADPVIGNSAPGIQPGLYLRPDFRAGMARLSALGLSLDAWCFHPQLPDITDLARAFPASNIIVGHCGGPLGYGRYAGQRDAVFADWKRSITDLASCPSVSIKLGGMMMRLAAYDYLALDAPPSSEQLAAHWRPYVETCIERFGANRCLAESNFPVEKMGIGYAALFNALKRLASGCSADEKAAIFAGTARRVYRLDC